MIPVILAGGKGERFWPVSRKTKPKQFLCLDGSGNSLLQATAQRLLPVADGWQNLWVITSALVADLVREQLPELPESNLLVEPEGKDTAAAVAWATIEVQKRHGKEAIIGFFPADHWIGDTVAFISTLNAAKALATHSQAIVTLGITPNYPSTGYGYIQQGSTVGEFHGLSTYKVARFTEKPSRPTAEKFLSEGGFSWNSGMFIFSAEVVLQELSLHAPNILEPLLAKGKAAYKDLEKKSIDYALMEKTSLAYVIPADFGWDDLGDWNALERLMQKEGQTNVELATHLGKDSSGNIFYASDKEEAIVTIGVQDLVVVRDGHVTLVVHKERTQEIKQVLQLIAGNPDLVNLL